MSLIDSIQYAQSIYGFDENDTGKFSIDIFNKANYSENDIFKIQYQNSNSNNRLGWLIPVDSLFSNDHDYVDDKHFKIYAQIGINFIKKNIEIISSTEHFHLLILHNTRLKNNNIDSILQLICSLIKYGYYLSSFEELTKQYYYNQYSNEYISQSRENKYIIVKKTNIESNDRKYLKNLFTTQLKIENHFYFRFILLYQIIEYFMENGFYELIEKLRYKKNNIGTIREKINEYNSEKRLINLIFNNYEISQVADSDFKLNASDFLSDYKEPSYIKDLTIPSIIYDVRNILIHNFYKYEGDYNILKNIIDKFEFIILEFLEKEYYFSSSTSVSRLE